MFKKLARSDYDHIIGAFWSVPVVVVRAIRDIITSYIIITRVSANATDRITFICVEDLFLAIACELWKQRCLICSSKSYRY